MFDMKHCLEHCLTRIQSLADTYFEACRMFGRKLGREP